MIRFVSLELEHFKAVSRAALQFAPGLNVLFGPNDLGKSTVALAIRAVLLIPADSAAANEFRSWGSEDAPQVTLTFQTAANVWWRVNKRFTTGDATLSSSSDGERFDVKARRKQVDEQLRELLAWGLPSPKHARGAPSSFLTEALLGAQTDVDQVLTRALTDDAEPSGRERLTRALASLQQDPQSKTLISQVAEELSARFTATGRRRAHAGSPWSLAAARVSRLEEALERSRQLADRARTAEATVTQLQSERTAALRDLPNTSARREAELRAARKRRDDLTAELTLTRVLQHHLAWKRAEERQQCLERAEQLRAEEKTARKSLDGRAAGLPDERTRHALVTLRRSLDVAEAALGGGLTVTLKPKTDLRLRTATDADVPEERKISREVTLEAERRASLSVGDLFEMEITAGSLQPRREAERLRKKWKLEALPALERAEVGTLDELLEVADDIERQQRELKARLDEASALESQAKLLRSQSLAHGATADDVIHPDHLEESFRSALGSLQPPVSESRIASLAADAGDALASRSERTAVELAHAEAAVHTLETSELPSTSVRPELAAELAAAEGAWETLRAEASPQKLEALERALTSARAEVTFLEADVDGWRLLGSALVEAEAEAGTSLGAALAPEVSRRFSELTRGRYAQVRLDPGMRTLDVRSGTSEAEVDVLSAGTRDQLATVLRLALATHLRSAVVLDDHLVHSDAARMSWFRDALSETGRETQVLIFTCRPDDYGLPSHRVDLATALTRADSEFVYSKR